MGLRNGKADVCQVAEQSGKPDQIAALRSEVQTLTEAVNAIRFADAGRGRAAGPVLARGGGAAQGRGGAAQRGSRGPPGAPPAAPVWTAAGRSGAPRVGTWEGGPGGAGRGMMLTHGESRAGRVASQVTCKGGARALLW